MSAVKLALQLGHERDRVLVARRALVGEVPERAEADAAFGDVVARHAQALPLLEGGVERAVLLRQANRRIASR